MRKLLCVLLVLMVVASSAFALDFTAFQTSFESFAQNVADALPFNASTGLNWSNTYIGQFPHFGLGLTVGATTIPIGPIQDILSTLGVDLPAQLATIVAQYGFPVPAYTVDLRIGGFLLPFDIGLKAGYVPAGALAQAFPALPISVDYLLAGADVRFVILKDQGLVPALSVGVGYNFIRGSLGVPGLLPGNIALTSFAVPGQGTYDLSLTNPSLDFSWDTSVIEGKAQLSKRILILTPYIGAAVSYSLGAHAGGGVHSTLQINGVDATQQQIDDINAALVAFGQSPITLTSQGIIVNKSSPSSIAYRAYGGVSIDLLFLSLDVGAQYNITTQSLGASVNVRLVF